MHRLTPVLLACSLLVAGSACRGRDEGAARPGQTPAPAGWKVERDQDFTIAVPPDWRFKSETSAVGNEFISFLSPKEVSGYPQGVVVGRTRDVRKQDFEPIAESFQLVQGDRKFGPRREIDVSGSRRKALLVESDRRLQQRPVTLHAWNVFVATPSSVSLNVELVAPEEIFDEGLFDQILQSLTVRQRGP